MPFMATRPPPLGICSVSIRNMSVRGANARRLLDAAGAARSAAARCGRAELDELGRDDPPRLLPQRHREVFGRERRHRRAGLVDDDNVGAHQVDAAAECRLLLGGKGRA